MNFKIIRIAETTEVCLHRDRNDEGEEIVRITAFVINSHQAELMLEQVVRFTGASSARRFVEDYSLESAREFLEEARAEENPVMRS
jgi:hypothetical protein